MQPTCSFFTFFFGTESKDFSDSERVRLDLLWCFFSEVPSKKKLCCALIHHWVSASKDRKGPTFGSEDQEMVTTPLLRIDKRKKKKKSPYPEPRLKQVDLREAKKSAPQYISHAPTKCFVSGHKRSNFKKGAKKKEKKK